MSKFQVHDMPPMLPAKCAGCGSQGYKKGRKYVDTGLDLEFYGVVYLCTLCLTEIVKELGLAPVATEEEVIQEEEKEDVVTDNPSESTVPSDPVPSVPVAKKTVHSPFGGGRYKESADNDSGTSEPATESGHQDVPSLAELLRS